MRRKREEEGRRRKKREEEDRNRKEGEVNELKNKGQH